MVKARVMEADDDADALKREAENLAKLNEDEGGEVFRAIEELRATQGTIVVIVKLSPVEEAGICDSIPVAEFTLDELKRRYGWGNYRIRVRGPTGWIPGGGTVKISPVGMPKKPAPANDFQAFLEQQMRKDAERTSKMWELAMISVPALIAGLFNRQAPQSDMPAILAALKPTAGPTLAELSSALVNMQTLSTPKQTNDPIDTVLKVFEAARELGDGGGTKGNTNWLDIVRDVIKEGPGMVKSALDTIKNAPGVQAPPVVQMPPAALAPTTLVNPTPVSVAVAMPAIAAGAVAPSTVTPETDMYELFKPIIKPHFDKVIGWAVARGEPALYAEVFLNELPSNIAEFIPREKVIEYLNHPRWFEYLCSKEAACKPYEKWLNNFRLELLILLNLPDEEINSDLDPTGTAVAHE